MKKVSFFLLMALLVSGVFFLNGCNKGEESRVVKNGDEVKVEYTGTLADGTQFDSNVGGEPLDFVVGSGQLIEGFDKAVLGMKVGETKTVTIPAAEAYGERREDLVIEIPRERLAPGMDPQVGDIVGLESGGQTYPVPVVATSESTITIDANHQLAGKDLTFTIKLLEIVK